MLKVQGDSMTEAGIRPGDMILIVHSKRHNQAGEPIAVIHNFPAEVCEVCGEEYYAAEDWQRAERLFTQPPLRVAQVPVYELRGAKSNE